jgi:hypothetical protein
MDKLVRLFLQLGALLVPAQPKPVPVPVRVQPRARLPR